MSDTVWITHPETGAVVEVAPASLPMLRQSGWQELTDDELDERGRAAAEDVETAEAEMREKAAAALGQTAAPVASEDARTADELVELGEVALADVEPPAAVDLEVVPGPPTPSLPEPAKDAGGRQTKKGNA